MSRSKKKTLVIGASDNPERYSYLAIHQLRSKGHPVVALGRKKITVADVPVTTHQEIHENIDTVTLYVAPQHQQEYYNYILQLRPKRIIFNPGTENVTLVRLAEKNGIEAIEACTLVLLSTGQF